MFHHHWPFFIHDWCARGSHLVHLEGGCERSWRPRLATVVNGSNDSTGPKIQDLEIK